MSMMGNYRRVTSEVLADLHANPNSILDFLFPDDRDFPAGSYLDIDRAWHAIHFLLNGSRWEGGLPLFNAVLGGTPIGDEDLVYGPACSLNAAEVEAVAEALDDIPAFQLLERFDAETMNDEEIYPHGWTDDPETHRWISDRYLNLVAFFKRASLAGDSMIVYLS